MTKTISHALIKTQTSGISLIQFPQTKEHFCNDTYLLGGSLWADGPIQKNKGFERKYFNLPEHTTIRFTINSWALDGWDYISGVDDSDYFFIVFDSNPPIYSYLLGYNFYDTLPSLCGPSTRTDVRDILIFGSVPHSSSSLTLKIISLMSSITSEEAFGIRDIKLLFSTNPAPAPLCADISVPFFNFTQCTCSKGLYDSGVSNIICTECHPNCASCFGGSQNECYECKEGNYFDGESCQTCHSSCSSCSGPNINQCSECYPGNILFENICIESTRCISLFITPICTNTCFSPCDIMNRDNWEEDCFPPCPTGAISDLQGFCHCKFLF